MSTTTDASASPVQVCWSRDGDEFRFDTLTDLLDHHSFSLKPGDKVWHGTADQPSVRELFDANDVIETMGERAYDIAGEYAEDYPNVSEEARQELDQLLEDWMNKHAAPTFFTVSDIQSHILTESDFITTPEPK
jgi:hypothetical protein